LNTIFQQVQSLPSLKGHDKKGLIDFPDAVRNLSCTAVAFDRQAYISNHKRFNQTTLDMLRGVATGEFSAPIFRLFRHSATG
jgi:hypothetical protein